MAFLPVPTNFTEGLRSLPADLGPRGNQARGNLAKKGFVVVAGLTEPVRQQIVANVIDAGVRRFCPNDDSRFGTEPDARRWNGKEGGRAAFPLAKYVGRDAIDLATVDVSQLDPADLRIVGNGWEGQEPKPK